MNAEEFRKVFALRHAEHIVNINMSLEKLKRASSEAEIDDLVIDAERKIWDLFSAVRDKVRFFNTLDKITSDESAIIANGGEP